MTVKAPYRFVPLSNLVVFPDWANDASHDKPFKDGICGELEIEITTHGEMCVGGEQVPSSEHEPGKVRFYRTPDNKPAIPATSLKGMLRNVVEIATFSRFKQVEDQKLGVRDISSSKNFYFSAIKLSQSQSGWLRFEDNKWVVYPCSYARVHQQEILTFFDLRYESWKDLKSAKQRYDQLGTCPEVNFSKIADRYEEKQVTLNKDSTLNGYLVVTGQPNGVFDKNNINTPIPSKKYEFVFYDKKDNSFPITPKVMSEFRQIHEDTVEWQFWLNKLPSLKQGIPVFFNQEGQKIASLGLAKMYKLAYKNSIHDAINHTSTAHTQAEKIDFADLLFGYIGEDTDNQQGLRGRVSLGIGSPQENITLKLTSPMVLSTPKPTYYPAYIRQDNKGNSFNQLMQNKVELSGWKRYPIKPINIPTLEPLVAENKNVQVRLETVPENTVFHSKIRIHNVRPVELGALIWSLRFGDNKDCYHGLGVGKPYGFGKVQLNINHAKLRRNDQQDVTDNKLFLSACVSEFEKYMDQVFTAAELSTTWMKSGNIEALIDYAQNDPSNDLDYLPTPKDFVNVKKASYISEFISIFHQHQPAKVESDFDSQTISYATALDQQIEDNAKQQERDQEKQNATAEDKVLMNLEDYCLDILDSEKSSGKNAYKRFDKDFNENWENFSDDQKEQFKLLMSQVEKRINQKRMTQIVKKINAAT